jgi:hypothetical protein
MTPAVMTLAGSAIAGAANGYAANQKHLIDKQLATSQAAALEANAALAKSKANQAGLEGMKFNPGSGGLINAAWKPAPIVPPSQRTPA